jgi:carboxyl-terminal processing protease
MRNSFFKGKKIIIAVAVASVFVLGFVAADVDFFLRINKSIDIFGRVYRELTLNYVDELDPEKLMRTGIDGMLGGLDPYTTFIGEGEGDDVELITTGKYAGIGITIGIRDGYVTIVTLMEGYAAERQGLQVGDRIIEIDGVMISGAKPEQVRSLTRGEPGTIVQMKVEREGESEPLEFAIVREEIKIKNISFAGFVDEGIAYVRLDRFSRGAGDELRTSIKDLNSKGSIKGLILDLRENPGGLLETAVDVASKFLPQASPVVSTRGRQQGTERKYTVREEPILKAEPLVVLVSRNSASASEIVAGAIQDLDRGVILGTRTFGKGLVQTVTSLVYNTQLKVTTAKYYTPSNRSIQEVDYMHKGKDGLFKTTPDSLKRQFQTAGGRPVYELGGVAPDTVVEKNEPSPLHRELLRKSMIFKFATAWATTRKDDSGKTSSDDVLMREFQAFVAEREFTYEDPGEVKLKELGEIAKNQSYTNATLLEIERLSKQIEMEKRNAFDRNRKEILRALRMEIAARCEGERGRIAASLSDDAQLQTAISLLKDEKTYRRLLRQL